MALADLALRAAGLRARPPALRSTNPPRGALESPNFYGTPHQPLWPVYEGTSQVEIAERNLYAMRSVEKIAESISRLPYCAGNVKSRLARPTSQRMQLLGPAPGAPNSLWSSQRLWRYLIIQYLITGKMGMINERDGSGRIVALWPLLAQYLVPVLAPAGGKSYFEGYRYGTRGAQGYREFQLDEVTYIYRPSQRDMRQPEAPLRLAQWGINILQLIDEFDQAFLKNGGVPAHLVITPSFTQNDDRVAFRDQFRTKFGGPRNAGKPAFAEYTDEQGDYGQGQPRQTVDVKTIGLSQKDSQMALTREARIDDMVVAIGVPLTLLGLSRESKYTNMDNDRVNYWRETADPLQNELSDNLNVALSEMDGPQDVGWFDTSGVPELRKPPVFTEQGGLAAVAAGVVTENEYRSDRGLPPKDGGDEYHKPAPAAPPPHAPGTEPQQGTDMPPIKTSPNRTVKVTAVRTDLLDVVRAQLATELAAQRSELEARRDGRRGGRRRAHAALDLGLVYDQDHWQRRMATNLAPGLRAAGYGDDVIESFSVDVTRQVLDQLDGQTSIAETVWDPGAYLPALDRPTVQLDAGLVETVLAQVAGGQHDAAAALALLGGGG
jgi:phage portal protein BeeE